MKTFVLKAVVLIVLVAMVIGGVALSMRASMHDPVYEAALIDKQALLRQSSAPRLIFIGGSNLAFGLDSEKISQFLGRTTVNMGVHAGLGLRYFLSEVEPFVRAGDVVILTPEYEQFFGKQLDGDGELAYCFVRFPEARAYVTTAAQRGVILRNFPYAFRKHLRQSLFWANETYLRRAFNKNGDVVAHLGLPRPPGKVIDIVPFIGDINPDAIEAVRAADLAMRAKGARLVFMYPAILDAVYIKNEAKISELTQGLTQGPFIPIIGDAQSMAMPDAFFYDTFYHLNAEGRRLRTQKVVDGLRRFLK